MKDEYHTYTFLSTSQVAKIVESNASGMALAPSVFMVKRD